MIVSYRFRLLPAKAQHRALEKILESQRQLYNAALEERIGTHRKADVSLTYRDQTKGLTEWRRSDAEASALPVCLQRATLKRLHEAYRGFFRRVRKGRKPGLPRYRGKGWFQSFGFSEFCGITLKNGRLRFKGMPGGLRVHWHRHLPAGASPRTCAFKRDTKGWTVSFAVAIAVAEPRTGDRTVGLDLGISTFAALSDGGFIPSLKAARKAERWVRQAQRRLERRKRGSSGRERARMAVARCHAAVTRERNEHLHQASARLVRDYDAIAIEKLNVRGLAQGTLAKDVRDASWARFISMLTYKAAKAGTRLIEVDPHNTSQDCSGCGVKVSKDLGDRTHACPHCGLSIDRDLNAARNILNRAGVGPGLRNVAGYGMRAGGNLDSAPPPHQEAMAPN